MSFAPEDFAALVVRRCRTRRDRRGLARDRLAAIFEKVRCAVPRLYETLDDENVQRDEQRQRTERVFERVDQGEILHEERLSVHGYAVRFGRREMIRPEEMRVDHGENDNDQAESVTGAFYGTDLTGAQRSRDGDVAFECHCHGDPDAREKRRRVAEVTCQCTLIKLKRICLRM